LRASEFVDEAKAARPPAPEPFQVAASVLRSEPREVDEQTLPIVVPSAAGKDKSVDVGDTVRVRYLSDDKKTVRITISKTLSDPDNGVIHFETPIAKALLGAEEGDEFDVLVGSYVRPAVVESISKSPS
jgi:transcription elongation GreA/GreB family factor